MTGGHPKAGQLCEEGIITEAQEELGIDISNQQLEVFDWGCDGKDCYKMYYTMMDIPLESMKIQEEELTEVRWFSMSELNKMVETHELNPDQIACFVKSANYLSKKEL